VIPDRGHVAELERALDALRAVIAIRLEERRSTALGPMPALPVIDGPPPDEGLPPRDTFLGDGPLGQIVQGCGLSAAEALVLVAAIAPEVDESFEAWYERLNARPGSSGLTGEVARTLVARTFAGRLTAAVLLDRDAPLFRFGLLRLEGARPPALSMRLAPDPPLLAWILGRRPPRAEEAWDFAATQLLTVHAFDDLVVPTAVADQLRAVVSRIVHHDRVVEGWGFGRHHDNVASVVALFHGAPGTGKTMAAALVAKAAGLPAYAVDLSALVSKYIGDTQKHLAHLFDRAEREACVLVFDEADAIFGKRTELSDAHDRYANQDVGYLLGRIERHTGVVILATNLLANIDEAFIRRIDLQVEFPEPSIGERERLWARVLPPELPVGELDLRGLAGRYELTGAQIRDAAVEAAYIAAANGQVVTEAHLLDGIRGQYAKAGRSLPGASTAV
jgi:hypothetical protein